MKPVCLFVSTINKKDNLLKLGMFGVNRNIELYQMTETYFRQCLRQLLLGRCGPFRVAWSSSASHVGRLASFTCSPLERRLLTHVTTHSPPLPVIRCFYHDVAHICSHNTGGGSSFINLTISQIIGLPWTHRCPVAYWGRGAWPLWVIFPRIFRCATTSWYGIYGD